MASNMVTGAGTRPRRSSNDNAVLDPYPKSVVATRTGILRESLRKGASRRPSAVSSIGSIEFAESDVSSCCSEDAREIDRNARILRSLNGSAEDKRWRAARDIGGGPPHKLAVDALESHGLEDTDNWVRLRSAIGLCRMLEYFTAKNRGREFRSAVIGLLDRVYGEDCDKFGPVRARIVQGLRALVVLELRERDAIDQPPDLELADEILNKLVQVAAGYWVVSSAGVWSWRPADEDHNVRLEAVDALGACGGVAAQRLLEVLGKGRPVKGQPLLPADYWPVRQRAARALGELERWDVEDESLENAERLRQAFTKLVDIVAGADRRQRPDGAPTGKLKAKDEKLFRKDGQPLVREAAADALGLIGEQCLNEALMIELVRQHAPRIMLAMWDSDTRVRRASTKALACLVKPLGDRLVANGLGVLNEGDVKVAGSDDAEVDVEEEEEELMMSCEDTVSVTCRVLVSILRDRRPQTKARQEMDRIQTKLDNLPDLNRIRRQVLSGEHHQDGPLARRPSTAMRTGLAHLRKLEKEHRRLNTQLKRAQEELDRSMNLLADSEASLRMLGTSIVPFLGQRLLLDTDSGFSSRMALMRALDAISIVEVEMACSFLSEWVDGPGNNHARIDGKWITSREDLVSTLPLLDLEILELPEEETPECKWAVVHGVDKRAYLIFGCQDRAGNWMLPEKAAAKNVGGDSRGVAVHTGFWELIDREWEDICDALQHFYGKPSATPTTQLHICGGGLGGALAQVAWLRLCLEPPGSSAGPSGGDTGPIQGSEVMLMTYGSPNVLHGIPSGHWLAQQLGSRSTAMIFLCDPMPAMLSERMRQVHSHYTAPAQRLTGCLCRARRKRNHSGALANFLINPPSAAQRYAPLQRVEELDPPLPKRLPSGITFLARGSFEESLSELRHYSNALVRMIVTCMFPAFVEEDKVFFNRQPTGDHIGPMPSIPDVNRNRRDEHRLSGRQRPLALQFVP